MDDRELANRLDLIQDQLNRIENKLEQEEETEEEIDLNEQIQKRQQEIDDIDETEIIDPKGNTIRKIKPKRY